jgi:hypothetical protein
MTLKYSIAKAAILAGAALFVFGVGTSNVALAAEMKKGAKVITSSSDKVKVRITGQFSREAIYLDDGGSSRMRYQDSNYSSSRFRFHTDSKITSDIDVGALVEIAMDDNRNALSNTANFGGRSGNDFQTRKTEIWFNHKQFGRVWLGAGDSAANGAIESETHGVYGALPFGAGLQASGVQFRNSSDGSLSGIANSTVFPDIDFFSRQTRVRYDTPVIAGFLASVSHSDEQIWEAALRYSGKFLDTQIKTSIAYADGAISDGEDIYGGSISATHSSGLGVTFGIAATNEDNRGSTNGAEDEFGISIQGHYGRKLTELGKTTLLGEYWHQENAAADGDVGKMFAVVVQQNIDAAALELWMRYANMDLDRSGSDFDDINMVTHGARMKF